MPPPIVRKTSVFLALDNFIDSDAAISKKTHQEKQYKIAVRVLSFLIVGWYHLI
jgi:hypothetical protein